VVCGPFYVPQLLSDQTFSRGEGLKGSVWCSAPDSVVENEAQNILL